MRFFITRLYFCISLIFVLLLNSCSEFTNEKYISEGVIEFDVSYLDADPDNFMTPLLPKSAYYRFKEDKIALELSNGTGMFKSTFIADPKTKTLFQTVKMISDKFVLSMDSAEVNALNSQLPEIVIEPLNETKEIAGYKCKKAKVSFKDREQPSFDIFYTEEIKLKNPNWHLQYKEIDGVLLEFQLRKYNLEMKFTAKNVIKEEVDDAVFEPPKDYKKVSKEYIDETLSIF